jgi:hypothetical protein
MKHILPICRIVSFATAAPLCVLSNTENRFSRILQETGIIIQHTPVAQRLIISKDIEGKGVRSVSQALSQNN